MYFEDGRAPEECASEELRAFLARYVTEKENPENRRGVARVEVAHPASILARGVVLIDTPGIGSTFRHNTSTTLSFLPQCDAARKREEAGDVSEEISRLERIKAQVLAVKERLIKAAG